MAATTKSDDVEDCIFHLITTAKVKKIHSVKVLRNEVTQYFTDEAFSKAVKRCADQLPSLYAEPEN